MNLTKLKVYEPSPGSGRGGPDGGSVRYDRTEPTTMAVGGMAAVTLPQGTVQDAHGRMIYPYQKPVFTSFGVQGMEAA